MGHRCLAALGLVKDPDYQGNDQGYDQHPEQQREQHAAEVEVVFDGVLATS